MDGFESNDTDEWEESLETGEYLSDEEWILESDLMPVIWYNPLQPQGSWSDDEEDQEADQGNVVDPALANAPVEPINVEPQGANEEEDLDPMPDLDEYARILQRLAIEQRTRSHQSASSQSKSRIGSPEKSIGISSGNSEK